LAPLFISGTVELAGSGPGEEKEGEEEEGRKRGRLAVASRRCCWQLLIRERLRRW